MKCAGSVLLLLGFAGALRRSELVALDIADLKVTVEGFIVLIRKSKTDQESEAADCNSASDGIALLPGAVADAVVEHGEH